MYCPVKRKHSYYLNQPISEPVCFTKQLTLPPPGFSVVSQKMWKNYKNQKLKWGVGIATPWAFFVNTNGMWDVKEDVISFNMIPNMGCL